VLKGSIAGRGLTVLLRLAHVICAVCSSACTLLSSGCDGQSSSCAAAADFGWQACKTAGWYMALWLLTAAMLIARR
jgi:hypothetical protein